MKAVTQIVTVGAIAALVAFVVGVLAVFSIVLLVGKGQALSAQALMLTAWYVLNANIGGFALLFCAVLLAQMRGWTIAATTWLFPLALSASVVWWVMKAVYWPDPIPADAAPLYFENEPIAGGAAAIIAVMGVPAAFIFRALRRAMRSARSAG